MDQINSDENRCFDEVFELADLEGMEFEELDLSLHQPGMQMIETVEEIEEIQCASICATVEHGKKRGRKRLNMTDEERKEYKKEYARQYYHKRMEDPEIKEERKEYRRQYYLKRLEDPTIIKERNQKRKKNPANTEKLASLREKKPLAEQRTRKKLYLRQWRLDNPEYGRIYRARPSSKELNRIKSQKWRANPANKVKQQARHKRRMADPRYRENNKRRLKALYQRTKLLKEEGLIANQAFRICIPENRLLRWLNINQYSPFSKTGLNLKNHIDTIPLPKLIKSFPKLVSDTFLRQKKYWIYILVTIPESQLQKGMSLLEIEELIRSQADNENFIIYVYVGMNSCGMQANKYHASSKRSTPNRFHWKGHRVFEAHFIDCNIARLNLTTATGDQLRQAVLQQEEVMKRVEAFIIRFGKQRNNRPFPGIQQRLINRKDEPLTDEDATKADQLAQSGAEMFNFARNIKFPTENPGMIFAGGIPFRLISELKFAAKRIGF